MWIPELQYLGHSPCIRIVIVLVRLQYSLLVSQGFDCTCRTHIFTQRPYIHIYTHTYICLFPVSKPNMPVPEWGHGWADRRITTSPPSITSIMTAMYARRGFMVMTNK